MVDNSPVEIVEIATGKVVAVYDSVKLLSQAHGTDEYVVRDYSQYFPTGPYYEYKVATITPSGIEYHSSVRLLQENAYSVIFTPIFTPKKKIVTCEYDSMNALELVVRDSTLNKLHSTSLSLTNSYEIRSIAIGVNKIIYSGYYEGGFILDLINGTLDSSHILPPTDNSGKIEISSDGNKLFLPNNSNDILVSYDIPSKTTYTLTSYPTRMYLSSLALSLDDKRIAYVLTDSNNEDQLVVLQLP
ncbi:MAG TPA: hypothetical protein VIX80_04170 [Candidatus Kapabacteria bacterium]